MNFRDHSYSFNSLLSTVPDMHGELKIFDRQHLFSSIGYSFIAWAIQEDVRHHIQ
jgi:hypothetical protein